MPSATQLLTPYLQLDTRIESVDVQLAKINAELTTYQQRISKMRDGPGKQAMRQKAMKVLQRRKMYETQKDQLEQQSWNMQQAGMMQDNLKSRSTTTATTTPSSFSSVLQIAVVARLLLPWRSLGWEVAAGVIAWVVLMWWWSGRADVMVTVDAMKTTNKELKKQYGKVNIDKSKSAHHHCRSLVGTTNRVAVEQMQDEMADLMDIGNDIQESISRSYDVPDGESAACIYARYPVKREGS